MYEKPQYLTPDGYRRLRKSPAKKALPRNAKASVAAASANIKGMAAGTRGISPQAAKVIAMAISAMLRQK